MAIVIIILLIVALVATLLWRAWKERMDLQKLRENPPQKIALLVRLPRESEKSNVKMTRFFSRMERLISHDSKKIADNQNVVSAALVGSGGGQGQAPTVRFIVWTPPELAERVMMELQECYEGQAQITELKGGEDPLGDWLHHYQEAQRMAQAKPEEDQSEGEQ